MSLVLHISKDGSEIGCNELVSFIKLQQDCQNQACCSNLSFVDLVQLVETTCTKPVDSTF